MKGLGLLKDSYHDLEGKTDEIAARAADFVRRNQVHGLIVAGGFVTLFNSGLEAKIAEVMRIPVTSALPSVTAALNSLSVTKVMLVTPFIAEMNAYIEKHLTNLGFTVVPVPPYDKTRKPGAGVEISPDELFQRVEASYRPNPTVQSVYFQGAILDPLPIILKIRGQAQRPGGLQQHRDVLERPIEARFAIFNQGLRQVALVLADACLLTTGCFPPRLENN